MATKKSSSSSTSKTTTTTAKSYDPSGKGGFVGGTTSSAPSSSSTKTTTKKSSGGTISYSDAVAGDTRFGFTGAGSTDGSKSGKTGAIPGFKMNSQGQATDSAGNLSSDRGPSMLPGAPGSSQATTPGPVTTSDPATNAVGNLGNQINQGLNNPPVSPTPGNPMGQYNPAFDPSKDLAVQKEIQEGNKIYADRQKELKAERDAAIADLKVSAQIDKQQLAESQRKETGVSNRNLAYLQQGGQSASAMAYMNDLEMSHGREQANLTAKYNSAILAARVAYSEKDFQLADAMVKNAQTIKKEAYDRNQDFLDNALKINSFVMEQKKFQFQQEQAEYERQKETNELNKSEGVVGNFYMYPGSSTVYDSRTRAPISFDQYKSMGGTGEVGGANWGDVQVVQPKADYSGMPVSAAEYEYAKSQGYSGSFTDYQNEDANRKLGNSGKLTEVTYETGSDGKNYKITKKDGVVVGREEEKGTADVTPDVIDAMGSELSSMTGRGLGDPNGDNHVSPETWNAKMQEWLSYGYSGAEFNKNFANFINPNREGDYSFYPAAQQSGGFTTNSPVDIQGALNSGGLTLDGNGNKIKGWSGAAQKLPLLNVDGKAKPIPQVYPQGYEGGQCGVWVRNMVTKQGLTYPAVGNTLTSKSAIVAKYGTKFGKAGSVMVTNEAKDTGHIAYVINTNDKGYFLAESNYRLDGKVQYGRFVPYGSKSIVGFINPYKA